MIVWTMLAEEYPSSVPSNAEVQAYDAFGRKLLYERHDLSGILDKPSGVADAAVVTWRQFNLQIIASTCTMLGAPFHNAAAGHSIGREDNNLTLLLQSARLF